jgi:hypothetical protein
MPLNAKVWGPFQNRLHREYRVDLPDILMFKQMSSSRGEDRRI